MNEAVFRITHHSVYANATANADVSMHMWCGRHADLLYLNGADGGEVISAIQDAVGIADHLEVGDELVAVTDQCLLSHQDNLLEQNLDEHNCLTFYPVSYTDGHVLTRVISLERSNLSAFYDSVRSDFQVEVVSIRELDTVEHHPSLVFSADLPAFSSRQRESLTTAFEMGYYEIPRETTTADVAAELGINRRTFEDHLRRAEKKAVASLLEMTDV